MFLSLEGERIYLWVKPQVGIPEFDFSKTVQNGGDFVLLLRERPEKSQNFRVYRVAVRLHEN